MRGPRWLGCKRSNSNVTKFFVFLIPNFEGSRAFSAVSKPNFANKNLFYSKIYEHFSSSCSKIFAYFLRRSGLEYYYSNISLPHWALHLIHFSHCVIFWPIWPILMKRSWNFMKQSWHFWCFKMWRLHDFSPRERMIIIRSYGKMIILSNVNYFGLFVISTSTENPGWQRPRSWDWWARGCTPAAWIRSSPRSTRAAAPAGRGPTARGPCGTTSRACSTSACGSRCSTSVCWAEKIK